MKVSLTEYRSHTCSHAHVFTHTHLSTPPPTGPRSLAGLFASGLRDFLSNFRWMISPQQRTFLSFFSFSPSLSFLLCSYPSSALLTRVWTAACEVPQVSRCCCCCCPFRGSVERRIFSGWSPRHLGFSRFRSDRTVFTESRDRCGWNKEEGEKNTHQRSWSRFVSFRRVSFVCAKSESFFPNLKQKSTFGKMATTLTDFLKWTDVSKIAIVHWND